jgi:hypothetical protein
MVHRANAQTAVANHPKRRLRKWALRAAVTGTCDRGRACAWHHVHRHRSCTVRRERRAILAARAEGRGLPPRWMHSIRWYRRPSRLVRIRLHRSHGRRVLKMGHPCARRKADFCSRKASCTLRRHAEADGSCARRDRLRNSQRRHSLGHRHSRGPAPRRAEGSWHGPSGRRAATRSPRRAERVALGATFAGRVEETRVLYVAEPCANAAPPRGERKVSIHPQRWRRASSLSASYIALSKSVGTRTPLGCVVPWVAILCMVHKRAVP